MSSITRERRGRPVTHDEARESARRLINSHFRNPDQARATIPVDWADDDVTICDYIAGQREKDEATLRSHQ